MNVTQATGALKKFRRTPWRFQQTVERPPVAKLDQFVSTIVCSESRPIDQGVVTLEEIVFGKEQIRGLIGLREENVFRRESSISAQTTDEVQALLLATFLDGPDFIFVPTPKPFVFYADHDDWITFYANTMSHFNGIIKPLTALGCRLIRDWRREL